MFSSLDRRLQKMKMQNGIPSKQAVLLQNSTVLRRKRGVSGKTSRVLDTFDTSNTTNTRNTLQVNHNRTDVKDVKTKKEKNSNTLAKKKLAKKRVEKTHQPVESPSAFLIWTKDGCVLCDLTIKALRQKGKKIHR